MNVKGAWLAEICGTTRQNIYKLSRLGELKKTEAGEYDTTEFSVKSYLASCGKSQQDVKTYLNHKRKAKNLKNSTEKIQQSPKQKLPKKREISDVQVSSITGLPKELLGLSIRELVRVRGDIPALKDWASTLKILLDSDRIELQTRERRNELIEKDFVVSHLKKYIDQFVEEVMNAAEAQTEEIIALVISDPEKARKEIPKIRVMEYTKISRQAKVAITKSLKNLEKKYAEDRVE